MVICLDTTLLGRCEQSAIKALQTTFDTAFLYKTMTLANNAIQNCILLLQILKKKILNFTSRGNSNILFRKLS